MKWRKLLVAAGMISLLAACGDEETEVESADANEEAEMSEEAEEQMVEFEFQPIYFDDMTEETLTAFADSYEIELLEFSDSAAVFLMTQERLDEIIEEYRVAMDIKAEALVDEGFFKEIKTLDDYHVFELVIDPATFEGTDQLGEEVSSLYVSTTYYHAFQESLLPSITFRFINGDTNEVIDETVISSDDVLNEG